MDQTNKTNFSWPITSTAKEVYDYFIEIIEKNIDKLKSRKIIIYGAGVRGNLLCLLLEKYGLTDIVFTDSNESKWNGCVNQYDIISPEESLKLKPRIFMIPFENSVNVQKYLIENGLIKDEDFLDMDISLYDVYVDEFLKPSNNACIVLGDCGFSHVSLSDTKRDSLGKMLKKHFREDNMKILCMHGMGMRSFYNVFKNLPLGGKNAKYLVQMVNFDSLTSKHHIMPRSQHVPLMEKLYNFSSVDDEEFTDYLEIIKKRFTNFQLDDYVKAVPTQKNNNSSKFQMRLNYMYKLNENAEGFQYLIKQIDYAKEIGIPVLLYIPPVNHMLGKEYWGEDFLNAYNSNLYKIKMLAEKKDCDVLDLSFLLTKQEFASVDTNNEIANYNGRVKIVNKFEEYFSTR